MSLWLDKPPTQRDQKEAKESKKKREADLEPLKYTWCIYWLSFRWVSDRVILPPFEGWVSALQSGAVQVPLALPAYLVKTSRLAFKQLNCLSLEDQQLSCST